MTQDQRQDLDAAQRAHAVADLMAQGQMPGVDASALFQEVSDRVRPLVVGYCGSHVANVEPLPADDGFDAGLVDCGATWNSLENLPECNELTRLEVNQID